MNYLIISKLHFSYEKAVASTVESAASVLDTGAEICHFGTFFQPPASTSKLDDVSVSTSSSKTGLTLTLLPV